MPRACGRGGVKVWRCAAGVQTWRHRGMKLWSFAVKSCRRGGVCLERSGTREACCGPGDVEVFASRDRELETHAAGLGTLPQKMSGGMLWAWGRGDASRCLPQELRCSEGAQQACRRGGVDVWSNGDALQPCRRGDVEVWKAGA